MTFKECKAYIESLGYEIVAQLRHPGEQVSYDARKLGEKKLVRGAVAPNATQAMYALMREIMRKHTDLPWNMWESGQE